MDKQAKVTKFVSQNMTGLELGPLDHPILSKDRFNIRYVDHMQLQDLKEKYKNEPVDLEKIAKPDYVLRSKKLSEVVKNSKFDYIIASHVIEHIPDIVSWLQDIASVLEKNGKLILFIPDKRFTFDITRNVSKPADIYGAYLDKLTRPNSATMYDFAFECRDNINVVEVWNNPNQDFTKKPHYFTNKEVLSKCKDNVEGKYVDCHCYVFTPYSFVEVLKLLVELELFNYKVLHFEQTPPNHMEFFVVLSKSNSNKSEMLKSLPKLQKPKDIWEISQQLSDTNEKINTIHDSLSWKITAPLRKTKSKLSRVK